MKINTIILFCLVLSTLVWTYFSNNDTSSPQQRTQDVQNFTFQNLQNETMELNDFKGKPILVHFWASWCAPCLEELPQLIKLANNNPSEMQILAIAVEDKPEDIERFLNKASKNIPNNFIIGLDPNKKISAKIFNTVKLPETYMLNRDLHLFEKIIGAQENWKAIWNNQNQASIP